MSTTVDFLTRWHPLVLLTAARGREEYSSPLVLHADGGMKTRNRPSVRAVKPCREARPVEPQRTCTAKIAASRTAPSRLVSPQRESR